MLGWCNLRLNQLDAALSFLLEARQLGRDDGWLHSAFGELYTEKQKYAQALEHYQKALEQGYNENWIKKRLHSLKDCWRNETKKHKDRRLAYVRKIFFELRELPAFARLKHKIEQQALFEFAREEVFPGNQALVLVNGQDEFSLDVMKWGIEGPYGKLINARSEGIEKKRPFAPCFLRNV